MTKKLLCCLVLLLVASAAHAQSTATQQGPSATEPMVSVIVPGNGMSMDQVAQRFGEPKEKVSSVGEPPISRWVYEGYTVFFEHDLVLHSVVHR
ncbi:MAG: hypothetical protein GWP66_00435 [Gammaproteobacteria bacterium]|jgi:hypothetical protein|nr:hypothetical protein [Gammaproteobacteria bacterium]